MVVSRIQRAVRQVRDKFGCNTCIQFVDINIQREIREIVSDPLSVAIHKASQLGECVISEDTSLDIEGEQVGVNVKWMLDELPKYIGKRALWNVYLAILVLSYLLSHVDSRSCSYISRTGDWNHC